MDQTVTRRQRYWQVLSGEVRIWDDWKLPWDGFKRWGWWITETVFTRRNLVANSSIPKWVCFHQSSQWRQFSQPLSVHLPLDVFPLLPNHLEMRCWKTRTSIACALTFGHNGCAKSIHRLVCKPKGRDQWHCHSSLSRERIWHCCWKRLRGAWSPRFFPASVSLLCFPLYTTRFLFDSLCLFLVLCCVYKTLMRLQDT